MATWRASFASPNIIAAMSETDSSLVEPVPANLPFRNTVTLSAKAVISRNLWLIIKTLNRPAVTSSRNSPSTSSASWGVNTEVGSSRIRMRLLR